MNKPDEYLQENIDSYTKAHKGEDPEEILADMRGKDLITDDDLDRSAKLYRKYREECGYQDPVALNEIENAFYEGELRQKVRDRYKYRDVIEGTYDCDDETSWIYFDGWALSTSELGKKVKLIIVKEG